VCQGFTLIEVAMAMLIVAIAAGGLLMPLSKSVNARYVTESRIAIEGVKTALLGYAVSHANRLPCPDIDGDGVEDRSASVMEPCPDVEGHVPDVTLGLRARDAWGARLRYRPESAFTSAYGVPQPPDTLSRMTVRDVATDLSMTVGDPEGPAAIVYSCGANRRSEQAVDPVHSSLECDALSGVMSIRTYRRGIAPGFDDQLGWVSKNVLLGRLIVAGTWPFPD
jgi:prepilin-type N-terminal cleavage/methylation domain-containing protein